MCYCSLFCFSMALIFNLVAASISHFLTAAMKLSCFSSSEIGLLCFLSLVLALSLLSTSMWTLKFSRKKDSALLLFSFLSQSLSGHAIYRLNTRVLETRNFTTAYMNGWTYVCAHGRFSQNQNFFGCIDNQIFLPMVLPCARFALAMSPLLQAITT